ncbi:methylated-DNA--[protein]-cysteine S-methyltransferase [Aerococcus urinaeequi]|uniref:methylated-DNA--[protein]-cysteine S-methyltransferase n=1 Tax=Aerococcus urinaeequi TaxID=51665 RepID=UPI002280D0D7|nr:methylated-DNA--[protein]-cysteine S-methyltransferase [Aerococcus urinaeequi]MCY7731066.1 methylated-DNA--[protein]-cysteine S-methyltransferase [Aerococcus urinaeequi]
MLYKYPYQSELGTITILANDHGLLGAWFDNQTNYGGTFDLSKVAQISNKQESTMITKAFDWLDNYFQGNQLGKVDFPLMPQGTAFQQDVWTEIQKIPYGQTVSLQELDDRVAARQTKGKGSLNAVAGAVIGNPIAIIIPSHRIQRSEFEELTEENRITKSIMKIEQK